MRMGGTLTFGLESIPLDPKYCDAWFWAQCKWKVHRVTTAIPPKLAGVRRPLVRRPLVRRPLVGCPPIHPTTGHRAAAALTFGLRFVSELNPPPTSNGGVRDVNSFLTHHEPLKGVIRTVSNG